MYHVARHAHSRGRASRPPASRRIAASMPSTCASPTTATTLDPSAPRSERAMYASRSAMRASYSGGTWEGRGDIYSR